MPRSQTRSFAHSQQTPFPFPLSLSQPPPQGPPVGVAIFMMMIIIKVKRDCSWGCQNTIGPNLAAETLCVVFAEACMISAFSAGLSIQAFALVISHWRGRWDGVRGFDAITWRKKFAIYEIVDLRHGSFWLRRSAHFAATAQFERQVRAEMNEDQFANTRKHPFWLEDAPLLVRDASLLPAKVDLLVVGSGYTGLSAAIEAARGGMSVLVLDRGPIGAGRSTRNGEQVLPRSNPNWASLRHAMGLTSANASETRVMTHWLSPRT